MKEELRQAAIEKGFVPQFPGIYGTADSPVKEYRKKLNEYLWMCELQQWLRDKHLLHIVISPSFGYVICRLESIYGGKETPTTQPLPTQQGFNSYELALETGLLEALKLTPDNLNKESLNKENS